MYLKIRMKTNFRELHFRRRSMLHKIGEFYLSDHGRQPQFGQNSILARSKAKRRNWKIINCFFIYICVKPFSLTKNEGKRFLVPKSSGPLSAGLPLNYVCLIFFLFVLVGEEERRENGINFSRRATTENRN